MTEIRATAELDEPPHAVFEFLSDLRNHWRLEDSFVDVGRLDGAGPHGPMSGRSRLRGPLGISRRATTRVVTVEPPRANDPARLGGIAELAGGTVGRVSWEVAPRSDGGSIVTLAAEVERASLPDRALLALGGRAYLRSLFRRTLANLATAVRAEGSAR